MEPRFVLRNPWSVVAYARALRLLRLNCGSTRVAWQFTMMLIPRSKHDSVSFRPCFRTSYRSVSATRTSSLHAKPVSSPKPVISPSKSTASQLCFCNRRNQHSTPRSRTSPPSRLQVRQRLLADRQLRHPSVARPDVTPRLTTSKEAKAEGGVGSLTAARQIDEQRPRC